MAHSHASHCSKKKAMTTKQPSRKMNPRRPARKLRAGETGKPIDFSEALDDEITVIAPAKSPRRAPSRPKS
jgi:hypothetical protein